ncbi:YcaO-like family protein [Thalassomonas viridans]|uniref:YcaO-like family protein n=1 Tax=Thalassomonas viridans TaxID=137584 RepID=A0AAF0C9Y3_9GAMM|nr:YcaO-like family protein [Thalassomonas viridans]WDE08007.1 YcaO-like family protein [Thalassomonas viridans]
MTQDSFKSYAKGTHRARSPEETLALMRPHMTAMGITRIANVTGLDEIGIPVVTVCRPNSRAVSVAQGKGPDLVSAKVSGLMEAIETYHGEHIDLPLRLASYREMKANHAVVDVGRLPKLSVSCFHQDLPILWVEGRDYSSGQSVYVPYEMVHCNYNLPLPTGSGAFMMSTNGLASGNHELEAVVHGLCELIERDATSLWQMRRHTRAANQAPEKKKGEEKGDEAPDPCMLNLASVDDPACLKVLSLFAQAGIAVAVWDTTSDLGIPSFYCTIINKEVSELRPLYPASGAGTHPCKAVALLRALTEAAQTRLTMISGSRDDVTVNEYNHGQNIKFQQRILSWVSQEQKLRSYREIPSWSHETFVQDMQLLTDKLSARGLDQVITVDLSKSSFNIPVVRVIVPGLEGIQDVPGYVPGQRAQQVFKNISNEAS